ncbi:AAA family ATPase [Aestuariibaculum lutulentum]|uniref:AAA family ATPase n=1 Tax=Aestuariibaculum lutulentum TaxID=2920935 RepID=A0ABS9RGB1_9FLAO|nr:AAA family ATPase [Aestuariibaculum lutulentum]MCH4551980.1 AAA family ATPase [Aestuariibaculum lutulentum]
MQLWKLGCRWGSNTPLFYDFIKNHSIVISWIDKPFQKNDWILIANGHTILAFAIVSEEMHSCVSNPNYKHEFEKLQIPFEDNLLIAKANWFVLQKEDQFKYQLQQGICKVQDLNTQNIFSKTLKKYTMEARKENLISLLKQKKQIILQGPPGTGKTRLAKILASELCNTNTHEGITLEQIPLTNANIAERLKDVESIPSASNRKTYRIKNIKNDRCTVILETNSSYEIPFNGIREAYKNRLWEGGQSNGFDPYNAAIAKYLHENNSLIKSKPIKESNDYALIQFHPSYTYEDFVRGIVVKNNGNEVEYKTENKILASLAAQANENYIDSKKDTKSITKEQWVKEEFEDFKDFIIDSMDSNSNYALNDTVNIIGVEEDAFRYTGNTWKNQFRMKYSDIIHLYMNNISSRKSIKKEEKISSLGKTHATYFKLLLDAFYDFMKGKKAPIINIQSIKQKNYVLIIDEINRANLPNVLGELIYALEYRGDSVESMYDIDGLNSIIIPPNLYIIGTMNTADRSVGHIDYAIRRRFAFVEVLPKILEDSELENKIFIKDKFIEVSKLFTSNIDEYILNSHTFLEKSEYLSDEFRVEDIWLGHSYFIAENEDEFKMKMEYEIKPILKEYVKDGILSESSLETINSL